jgi:choline dehydrogenase-like flavoprotein
MEIDLAQPGSNSLANTHPLRTHVCIIGAGIAGLTLAQKLTQLGHEVLLLEAGGHTPAASGDVVQQGDPHPGTTEPSIRAFGGTSLTWGGQLLPLPEDADWPISSAELAPFITEAEQLLGVNDLPYDACAFFASTRQPAPALLNELPQTRSTLSKFAPFTRRNLAQTLGSDLLTHSKARILLHAPVTELLLSPARDHIEAVVVRTPSGKTLRIEAAHTVLAAGTVEIVRLLLASRSVAPEGIGNQHDQVGRNFHDHLTLTAATFHNPARDRILAALRSWIYASTLHSLKLAASPELRAQLDLTPVIAHLTILEAESAGVGALRTLLRARQQGNLTTSLRKSLPHLPQTVIDAAQLTWSARTQHRRYISPDATVHLRLNCAQQTPSSSRITLSPDLKPILDWRIDPYELSTLRSFTQHLHTHLEHARFTSIDWNLSLLSPNLTSPIPHLDDARHPMGGAVMGTDPHTSVVTPDLRVHGLRNLWIASAATFPTGAPQLPTLPLMALTLRLAEHLANSADSLTR